MLDKVLVVGGSGFIGKRVMARHFDWHSIDIKHGEDFWVDDCYNYDAIILLAAHLTNAEEDYQNNLRIYDGLVRNVIGSKKQPFVLFASSAAVYEPSMGEHFENEFPRPTTLYGKAKLLGEQVVQDICTYYTILRFSNVYGDGDGHGVIDIFQRGGRDIYGSGNQVRDYIYVDKVVTAIERIIASPSRYSGKTFNISTGAGDTVSDMFTKHSSKKRPKYLTGRDYDIHRSVLNNKAATEAGLL